MILRVFSDRKITGHTSVHTNIFLKFNL